jgi:hypothetical protein
MVLQKKKKNWTKQQKRNARFLVRSDPPKAPKNIEAAPPDIFFLHN